VSLICTLNVYLALALIIFEAAIMNYAAINQNSGWHKNIQCKRLAFEDFQACYAEREPKFFEACEFINIR